MTEFETAYAQRLAECEANEHQWFDWPVTVAGHHLLIQECRNCGTTPEQVKRAIRAARATRQVPATAG